MGILEDSIADNRRDAHTTNARELDIIDNPAGVELARIADALERIAARLDYITGYGIRVP